jgi:hypothetical protein
MNITRFICALSATGFIALASWACNTSGLANTPRGTYAQLGCLDVNGDNQITADDAADASKIPDFNGDGHHDADDTAFLEGLSIPLDPNRDKSTCDGKSKQQPEYLVAHGYFSSSDVSCNGNEKAVLLLGVGGGVTNLKDKKQAAGIREILDDLKGKFDGQDTKVLSLVAGQAIGGATNPHTGMEAWLTNVTRVYAAKYPCMRIVLVGHSHGGVIVEDIAANIEADLGNRINVVVDLDRIEDLFIGDMKRPQSVAVFNVYETNDGRFHTSAYDAPNAENWDASGETGPVHGDDGGSQKPVTHTTIDNSSSVRGRIVDEVMGRSSG